MKAEDVASIIEYQLHNYPKENKFEYNGSVIYILGREEGSTYSIWNRGKIEYKDFGTRLNLNNYGNLWLCVKSESNGLEGWFAPRELAKTLGTEIESVLYTEKKVLGYI